MKAVFDIGIQGAAGLFFLLAGIAGLSDKAAAHPRLASELAWMIGGESSVVRIAVAVVELAVGAVLGASLFARVDRKLKRGMLLFAVGLLVLIMVIEYGVAPAFRSRFFDWITWGQQLILHLVLTAALFRVRMTS